MDTELLLGNERIKTRLYAAIRAESLSHCYLISGPQGSGRKPLLRLLSAGFQCSAAPSQRPCLRCAQCRKVLAGTHPDVIIVDDPDKQSVSVEQVRNARADAYIQPNEGNKKLYIFPRAQNLSPQCQNTLLKIMEEPPEYGVFLLVTDNPEKLLPTIRSRAAELALSPLPQPVVLAALQRRFPTQSADALQQAAIAGSGFLGSAIAQLGADAAVLESTKTFAAVFAKNDRLGLIALTTSMERMNRDALRRELEDWLELTGQALLSRAGASGVRALAKTMGAARTKQALLSATQALRRAIEYCNANVGAAHTLGMLAADL
ncbi:MAG: DNA polymerase III subunit [Oscillospiraceae bacterium]|nr:DNA polymerase III subunit [Oscillospiraceae bacterium]